MMKPVETQGVGMMPGELLLPGKDADWTKWACVACDQYTSEPEYWQDVAEQVGQSPSTLRLILPECFLPASPERIDTIHQAMRQMLKTPGQLVPAVESGYVLLERMTSTGARIGLVACADLEAYAYDGTKTIIRPTEETVASRLPPRLAVRRGACLESSHVMLLVDDPEKTLIEPLYAQRETLPLLYDFDLMMGGGHVRGWAVTAEKDTRHVTDALMNLKQRLGEDPLLLAVGDGNHSLATAKAHWEQVKQTLPPEKWANHPARFAMVEVVNIHDPALVFEPIHRVVTGVNAEEMMADWAESCAGQGMSLSTTAEEGAQAVRVVSSAGEKQLFITHPTGALTVATLQSWLDDYLRRHAAAKIDYIHGDDVLRRLSQASGAVGFLLPALDKRDFFPAIEQLGILPRKTFSMGHAQEKRFYMECRKIQ